MKHPEPIAVSVSEACRLIGIGRTKFYEAVAHNQIRTRKVGTKTVVEMAELRRFIASLPST